MIDWLIDWYRGDSAAPAACLVLETCWHPCNWARDREKEEGCLYTSPSQTSSSFFFSDPTVWIWILLRLSYCPSEKGKVGGAGWCPESVPEGTGVLTGVMTGVMLECCRFGSPSWKVFSCDWEEEEDEWVLSLELLRVSVLVLVFFIFLLLARGALSTVWRRNPSRLHLLNACEYKTDVWLDFYILVSMKCTALIFFQGILRFRSHQYLAKTQVT